MVLLARAPALECGGAAMQRVHILAIIAVLAIGVLIAAFVMMRARETRELVPAVYAPGRFDDGLVSMPATPNLAPARIVDIGACPYESCTYGQTLIAMSDVAVFVERPNRMDADLSRLERATTLRRGEKVRTESGAVLAERTYAVMQRSGEAPGLRRGQQVALYTYLGEGCARGWSDGRFWTICGAEGADLKYEWWLQVRLPDGRLAWTPRGDDAVFMSEGELNNQLAQILSGEAPLQAKLTQVDELIRIGAQLNGSGGQHGQSPMEGAIDSNSVELLRALIARGLNLRQGCPAYWAAQRLVTMEDGASTLQFLMDNGMDVNCIEWQPPMMAFLMHGIATDEYSAERAIAIARVLVAHHVPVEQRDQEGRTIYDRLNQYPDYRVGPLRAALREMQAESERR